MGTVLVGTSRYELDEDGIVDVSEEHAQTMLLGVGWAVVAVVPKAVKPSKAVDPVEATADAPTPAVDREREDLFKRAAELGLNVDRRTAKHKILSAIKAEEERLKK